MIRRVIIASLFALSLSAAEFAAINNGFLLVDGREIPPPFQLSEGESGLELNGHPVATPVRDVRKRGMRRRGPAPMARRGQELNVAKTIESILRMDGMVLLDSSGEFRVFSTTKAVGVLRTLASKDHNAEERLEQLLQFGSLTSAEWRELDEAFAPTLLFDSRVSAVETSLAMAQPNPRVNSALTILAFLLAVVGLGTLLLERPQTNKGLRGVNAEPTAMRHVKHACLLLAVLAIYDLVATLFFLQSGAVIEVNPLVAGIIESPISTTLFKVTLTGGAIALLLAMRRHRPAQLAAWWACVINTVLLLRWATVTSAIA